MSKTFIAMLAVTAVLAGIAPMGRSAMMLFCLWAGALTFWASRYIEGANS